MKIPTLLQAGKLYTTPIFEAFQAEYERSMAACARELDGNNTYVVSIVRSDDDFSSEKEHIVIGDPLEQTTLFSCEHFKRTGCCVPML
jgi:zinc finger SWIM domain-containing protein 3